MIIYSWTIAMLLPELSYFTHTHSISLITEKCDDVKDVMNEAFCDSLGNFDCEGRYDLKKCNYINSINEVELTKPENMPCQQISHNINPYQSAEARIMFSTWNLDHV